MFCYISIIPYSNVTISNTVLPVTSWTFFLSGFREDLPEQKLKKKPLRTRLKHSQKRRIAKKLAKIPIHVSCKMSIKKKDIIEKNAKKYFFLTKRVKPMFTIGNRIGILFIHFV